MNEYPTHERVPNKQRRDFDASLKKMAGRELAYIPAVFPAQMSKDRFNLTTWLGNVKSTTQQIHLLGKLTNLNTADDVRLRNEVAIISLNTESVSGQNLSPIRHPKLALTLNEQLSPSSNR